jgi:hypothetical protein
MQRPTQRPLRILFLVCISLCCLGCDDSTSQTTSTSDDTSASTPDTTSSTPDTNTDTSASTSDDAPTAPTDTASTDPDSDSDATTTPTDTASADTSDTDTSDTDTNPIPPLPVFRECIGLAFSPSFSGEWEHSITSPITVAVGDPGHSIQDLILLPTESPTQIEGKFAYGSISKDLEDEPIQAFLDDCSGAWIDLGLSNTDSDGRARFALPQHVLQNPGRYAVRMVVQGDGTQTSGFILVTPAQTQFVVFDIDGTLTTADSELLQQYFLDLFGGQHVPDIYDGALAIVQAYRAAGYEILFLTGRPYWLFGITRAWLSDRGFPPANLHLTNTNGEALPTEGGVGTYKLDYLRSIMANHQFTRAYGNATTDIYAYTTAPFPLSDIFIIGAHAGENGTQPVTDYPSHLSAISIPPASQPFTR